MARNSNRTVEGDAYADAIARGIPAKKVGYFESLNYHQGLRPRDEFKIAGPDEELLERPAYYVYIITDGPATITANGSITLKPIKVYADGIHEYEYKGRAQTPEGTRPGILSIKISEGTAYKYEMQNVPTGGSILY